MSKYYLLSGLFFLGGVVLVIFQAISSMMTPGEIVWKRLSLIDIVDAKYVNWIDGISWDTIQGILQHITTMPLFIILISVGILLFIIGILVQK
ncbi:MAG: hypothetical protein V3T59_06010 [Desulfobacterales bacterium]